MMRKIITLTIFIITTLAYSQQAEDVIGYGSAPSPEKEDLKIYEPHEVEVPVDFKSDDPKMNQFINENFVVPKKITEKKINGEIVLSFVVEKDGSLTGLKKIKDLGHDTGKELERVVKLEKWRPAELNGKKVRSKYNLTYTIKKQ